MTPIVEDAILGSDLDGGFYSLLNVKSLDPVPPNLATSDDVRLSDVREPIPGSVTNASVAAGAAIDQSKLNLNGQIPTAWLGTSPGTAAQGDLVEYLANKNQPNGYAGLDASGQIPSAMLPDSVGLATVTSVGLTMPGEFHVTGSPITGSGIFNVQWTDLGGPAWFGRIAAGSGPPTFQTAAIPLAMIPNLPAAAVTSGTFAPALLPLAAGVGAGHAPGAVRDPGDGSGGALATDYFGRDTNWHVAPTIAVGYQTTLPTPNLTVSPASGTRTVTPSYPLTLPDGTPIPANIPYQDATFFYLETATSTPPTGPPAPGFKEFPDVGYVQVTALYVWVYAAHPGYNNSPFISQH